MKYLHYAIMVLGLALLSCKQTNPETKSKSEQSRDKVKETQLKVKEEIAEIEFDYDTIDEDALEKYWRAKEDSLNKYWRDKINHLKELFKRREIDAIAQLIKYPLRRIYPIPSVNNEEEFKKRFYEIFDQKSIEEVMKSDADNWEERSKPGRAGSNVWIEGDLLCFDRDTNDNLIGLISLSEYEEKLWDKLVEKDKRTIHSSLRDFSYPYRKIITYNHIIRLDYYFKEGQTKETAVPKYRLAVWKKGSKESEVPFLVLYNGSYIQSGSFGGEVIIFNDGELLYEVFIDSYIFADDAFKPEAIFSIYKYDKKDYRNEGPLIIQERGYYII